MSEPGWNKEGRLCGWPITVSIDAQERSRVFDRFFRGGRRSASQAAGRGLGMAFVKSVADMHGAEVLLGDAPGGGSVATILLPSN
jgi:signal transduction histidine kinase